MSDKECDAIMMPPPKKARIEPEKRTRPELKMDPKENAFQTDQSNIDFTEDLNETNGEFSLPNSKYEDIVNPEEVERLKEFQVLDEIKSNDDTEEESDSSDGKSEGLPEEEIEKMLDEDLPDDFKATPKPKEKPYVTRQKIVLEEKGINHFEVLPLDWMMVRHYSGMPVYMHRSTRVCTLSKPYLLGKGNTRRHDIPISAIPCLNYRKALEEEAKQKEIDRRIAEQIKNGTWKNISPTTAPSDKPAVLDAAHERDNTVNNCDTEVNIPISEENNRSNGEEVNRSNGEEIDRYNGEDTRATNEANDEEGNKSEYNLHCENTSNNKAKATNFVNELDDNVDLGNHMPLQDANINLETVRNVDSNQDETGATPSDLQNGDCVENNESYKASDLVLDDTEKPKCPFKTKQDVQKLPLSEDCVEQNSVTLHEDSQSEIPPNAEENTEQNPPEDPVDDTPLSARPVVLPGGIVMPPPRVETVNTSWKTQQLSHEQVNDYCKKLFKFKTVHIMHFQRWADRRKYAKARKTLQYPTLPEGTKLITIPANTAAGTEAGGILGAAGGKASKRDWVMNMNGRSYLSVFHEYVRRALHSNPVYEFKQLENASTPYQATVYISGMQYGIGRGTSKRLAKANAARASIQILIPEMKDVAPVDEGEPDFSFFDYVGIEDPRITEFCAATCEPSPHATLRTCLLRNFGAGDRHIHTEMKKLEYQMIELTMKVGKHSATVVCKNKKTAKQRASQAILQALHPHVRSWGSLLRLYGSRSVKSCKERKLEEQQITLLQDQARRHEPNHAVLGKLRHEMQRLRERDAAVVPIGTLLLTEDLPTHSGSNLNNVDL